MINKFLKLTHSAEETKLLGLKLARNVEKGERKKTAQVIFLKGDLGAGKTTFVLGFLGYFGIKPHSASPTFVIMKRYVFHKKTTNNRQQTTDKNKIGAIYHLDAYRLRSKKDLNVLGFEEISSNPKNIILIEWPEKIKGVRSTNKISVSFSYGKKENERIIKFN